MIYSLFSSLWHNKLRVLLILILSTITFSLALMSLTNTLSFRTQMSIVEGMFSTDLDKTYRIDVSYIESDESAGESFEFLKSFANKIDGTLCGAYDKSGEYYDELRNNQAFLHLNELAYEGTFRSESPDIAETIFFDPELIELLNTPSSLDDIKLTTMIGEESLPLFAGKDYKGVLSVGDSLTLSRNGAKYIVAGFLDDEIWLNDNDPITFPAISLNHMLLAPFSKQDRTDSITQQSTIGKIFVNASQDTIDRIMEEALGRGIKLHVTSISDFIRQWKTDNAEILKLNWFLSVIVMLCSAISIISTLCVNVLLKKREYGIRIAFGMTQRSIIISLLTETVVLNIIAGTVAMVFVYHRFSSSIVSDFQAIYLRTLCNGSLLALIGLIVIFVAVVLIIPLLILSRYEPANLIKEDE